MDFKEKSYVPNPRETTNPLSKLFFWWIVPLFRKGAEKDLVLDDVYNVLREDLADKLGNELAMAWNKQLRNFKMKKVRPRFYRALLSVYGPRYLLTGIPTAFNECILRAVQPICLKWLIESFSSEEEDILLKQWLYAGGVCLSTFLAVLCVHPNLFSQLHIGMKMRIASSSLIYRKTLRLSKATENQPSIGKLVNLLSNDVNRFDTNIIFTHFFVIGPVQIIVFSYLLWQEFGASCMAGTGFVLLLMPVQYFIGKFATSYRMQIAERTDNRGRIMNEIIIAMRVIKMYAWEKPFGQLIDKVRRFEVDILKKASYLRALYLSLFVSSAKLISFLTFITYVLADENNVLTAGKVFYAVAIYNSMRQVMINYVPAAAAATGELIVAMNRIEAFLLTEEQSVTDNLRLQRQSGVAEGSLPGEKAKPLITMEKVGASWTKEKVTLDNLNISLEGDQLVIVCGPVGSGKTSLLHALIAELPITKGTCTVQGKTAYASQEPWIFSGNLRQNILFGHPYDEDRYNEILQVCALEDDLKQLPYGDNTVVGERGVSLSGGQKARVNLARALYQPSDIYFLDDPLSAVDSRVSRHIFEKCIKKSLKGSLRVLVTHQLQYLPQADQIIVFDEGSILAQGTYAELVERGIDFVTLLTSEAGDESGSRGSKATTTDSLKKKRAVKEDPPSDEMPEEQIEKMAVGSVNARLYWDYFRSGNSLLGLSIILFSFIFNQDAEALNYFWMEQYKQSKRFP